MNVGFLLHTHPRMMSRSFDCVEVRADFLAAPIHGVRRIELGAGVVVRPGNFANSAVAAERGQPLRRSPQAYIAASAAVEVKLAHDLCSVMAACHRSFAQ